jgi:hypothetical protein
LKSLVKNIFTAIVALTLLIGLTGFQVYKHICTSHNFSVFSFVETPECEMNHQSVEETDECCKTGVEENNELNCCELESINNSNYISITSQEIECCFSSKESSRIQDNLFPVVEKKIFNLVLTTTLSFLFDSKFPQTQQNLVLHNSFLPPPIFGKQLLQTIHQLKIGTPIC